MNTYAPAGQRLTRSDPQLDQSQNRRARGCFTLAHSGDESSDGEEESSADYEARAGIGERNYARKDNLKRCGVTDRVPLRSKTKFERIQIIVFATTLSRGAICN